MSAASNRPGTSRKACVSGLSVSRWKNKGSARAADCSITEFISKPQQHPLVSSLTETLYFCTEYVLYIFILIRKHLLSKKIAAFRCDYQIIWRMLFATNAELTFPQYKKKVNKCLNDPDLQELQKLLGSTVNFSTPTPTWSRLKSKLSLHRKIGISSPCLFERLFSHVFSHSCTARTLWYINKLTAASTAKKKKKKKKYIYIYINFLPTSLTSLLTSELFQVDDLSDAEKVYAECGQQQPLSWEECIRPQSMKKCVKIGEGTFGEVFTTTNPSGETVALKVIPLEGAEKVNGEDQKTFGEILHEIIISKELSSLKEKPNNQTHGFIGLKDLHCVQGCYPPYFIKAWDAFDRRKGSENDRPDFFEEDQFFLILEFEFGGVDLENSNGKLASLVVAKSVLHQVTAALAVAEQELHFEHRDLHWGNVLVKTTKQKTESFLLNGTAHHVDTEGVLVRIIDYSLSRLEIDSLTVSCDISNDEELFMGQGDYQFEIYRLMRQENGNNWSSYHPHTNVLWLHYLSSKLLSMKYRSRGKKDVRKELTRFHHNVLQYGSATEVLQNDPLFE
uniref:Serine/threonine-protein kinase haspin n=1 Tax=Salarias fasciatus TaxID=181472 RepID=A0A672FK51_SALFA